MIPTPQELAAEQQAAETPIVQHHVDLLAARLHETRPYAGRYIIDKPGVPYEHQKAVVAEFTARGWSAEFVDNQYRDETIASLRALLRNKENELADLRRDLSRSHGRIEFANPGSALRAASSCNPRNLPCPTCGEDDRLTPEDARIGYQCDECADRAEGRGGYE